MPRMACMSTTRTLSVKPSMNQKILVISGHPDLKNSIANRTILDEVAQAFPEADIRKLDERYPDLRIDIAAEQDALLQADIIVWQFPFSWYSVPGLMKLWIDQVMTFGFAHGEGARLAGKKLLISFTTGAPEAAYQKDGFFGHTLADYLPPFSTTAAWCNLDYQPPIHTSGISYTSRDDQAAIEAQILEARRHAQRLIERLRTMG